MARQADPPPTPPLRVWAFVLAYLTIAALALGLVALGLDDPWTLLH